MNSRLCAVSEVSELIRCGKSLLIAGDQELLEALPPGNWIAGTIPYFMAEQGGLITREKAFVTELPDYVRGVSVCSYDERSIENIYREAPENGFSVVIMPASSPVHLSFAVGAPNFQDFAVRPLVGWVSGVHLDHLGKAEPMTFNGQTGERSADRAVVLRAALSLDRVCDVGIVNIFEPGGGDSLEFLETGFSAREVLVNGERRDFVQYLLDRKSDLKLPLVANYGGVMVNISFQAIDAINRVVTFYAPVFKGKAYKQAAPVKDYVQEFVRNMPKESQQILFSCNCVLNFLYSELEGKQTGGITGPITFGEVAYQLLNQTLVYLKIQNI